MIGYIEGKDKIPEQKWNVECFGEWGESLSKWLNINTKDA